MNQKPGPVSVSKALQQPLLSLVVAEIQTSGRVIEANEGFYHLLEMPCDSVVSDVTPYISSPSFAELVSRVQDADPDKRVYQGLISFRGDLGRPHSLRGSVNRQHDHLYLIAEHDIMENERLVAAVIDLNDALAEQQRALARANRLLSREKAAQERLLNELQRAQAQLVQSEKLASVGQLAAGVAHEINNPIGFIRSNLTTLGSYVDDLFAVIDAYASAEANLEPEATRFEAVRRECERRDVDFVRQDAAAIIVESSAGISRIARIVQDLRDFARIDDVEWGLVDIHACLDSTLNVASNALRKKVEVIRQYGVLPLVYCCSGQLNQVVMSILANAIQAMQGSGHIFVRTGSDAEHYWIEIEDTGPGISSEDLGHIFDPFFSTKPIGQGAGLGLSSAWGRRQQTWWGN